MSEQTDVTIAATSHHVTPMRAYLAVFGALIVLTGITVGVSYMNLGAASLYVALLIAFIKSGFVVGFFMHLKYDSRFHQLIFFSSIIFVLILFGFTFIDLSSRDAILPEEGNFALRDERAAAAEYERTKSALPSAAPAAPAPPAQQAPATDPAADNSGQEKPASASAPVPPTTPAQAGNGAAHNKEP